MSSFLQVKDDLSNLADVIDKYDDLLSLAEEQLNPSNKTLEEANRQMPISYMFFAQHLQELKSLERFVDATLQQRKGKLWKLYKENSNMDLNTRDLEHYVTADDSYIKYRKFSIIVQELVGQYEIVVKAFEHLGYKLKDITAARIAEVHRYVL